MTDRPFARLSQEEALRALYIDFEGQKDKPPVLLGIHRRGRGAKPFVHQVVVDATFGAVAEASTSLHDAVLAVVRRAERKDRRVISWSEHDLEVVRTLADEAPQLVERFEARYANALRVARRWRTNCHPGTKPKVGKLANYLQLIDYPVPADAGGGDVGTTIGILRKQIDGGRPLTSGQRARWARLLEHNRFDCAGMREICLRGTEELGALQPATRPRRRRRRLANCYRRSEGGQRTARGQLR